MPLIGRVNSLLLLIAVSLSPTMSADMDALPKNLDAMIEQRISGVSEEERKMVLGWTAGKKLSEFFCQGRALTELGKTFSGADRVFLSISDADPPQLITRNRVNGTGSVRFDDGWAEFNYECEIDLQTGEPTAFTFDTRN